MNWEQLLKNPPDKNSPKHYELVHRAGSWEKCACCEVDVPKKEGVWKGIPLDATLERMGRRFYDYICSASWAKAQFQLNAIHNRAKELTTQP